MLQTWMAAMMLASPAAGEGRPATGQTGETREIPVVRSLYALRRLPPSHGLRGWVLRVALAESGPDGGPWMLALCHAKYTGGANHPPSLPPAHTRYGGAEDLGPVSVTVDPVGRVRRARDMIKRASELERLNRDVERLYAAPLPMTSAGRYVVRVWSEKLDLIQQRTVTVARPRPAWWLPLAEAPEAKTKEDRERLSLVVADSYKPAYPKYLRSEPIWRLARDAKLKLLRPADKGRGPGFLPGLLPPGPTWPAEYYGGKLPAVREGEVAYPLTMKLAGEQLVIRAARDMFDSAEENLLARWWVNGKPVAIDGRRGEIEKALEKLKQLAKAGREIRITLRLPAVLGRLKAGDRVGVQAMYCPGGTQVLPMRRMMADKLIMQELRMIRDAAQPMLTNRVTFAVTAQMLRTRKADGLDPTTQPVLREKARE